MKLIVSRNGKVFLNFAPICSFFDLLTSSIGTGPINFLLNHRLNCFLLVFFLMRVWFCCDFFYYRHRVLVVNNICCSIFLLSLLVVILSTTFIGPLAWIYRILLVVYWMMCFWKCSITSSFGSQLSQECGWAGSEHYVHTHITEPPCY